MERSTGQLDFSNFLPHRAPMLMVSRLTYIDSKRVEAQFDIDADCIFIRQGVLVESGLIENLAQVCSSVIGQGFFALDDLEGKGNKVVGYINTLRSLEILFLPKVGQVLVTEAEMLSSFDFDHYSMCNMKCSAKVDGELSVTCDLNFLIHEV